jgi:hypothetical protein
MNAVLRLLKVVHGPAGVLVKIRGSGPSLSDPAGIGLGPARNDGNSSSAGAALGSSIPTTLTWASA